MGTREAVVVQQVQQLVKLVKAICRLVDGALTAVLLCLDVALDYQEGMYSLSCDTGTHKLTKYLNRHFNIITRFCEGYSSGG